MFLRCLNDSGAHEFRLQLNEIKSGSRKEFDPSFLEDNKFSFEYAEPIEIDFHQFSNKKDIAVYLSEKLDLKNNKDLYYNSSVWSWLTAFYLDVVCPKNSVGHRKVNEDAKYILTDPKNWRRYYRHLLACSARLFCELGDLADPFLISPVHIWGDFHEQLTAYQDIATNKPLIETAGNLYWDATSRKLKKGAGSKGAGTPRRFSDVVGQFEMTFDLNAMPSTDILKILPEYEFKKWQPAA